MLARPHTKQIQEYVQFCDAPCRRWASSVLLLACDAQLMCSPLRAMSDSVCCPLGSFCPQFLAVLQRGLPVVGAGICSLLLLCALALCVAASKGERQGGNAVHRTRIKPIMKGVIHLASFIFFVVVMANQTFGSGAVKP